MLNENLLQQIYDTVSSEPGIDTPELCLFLESCAPKIEDPDLRGVALARWLSEFHDETWVKVCDHVDGLIETGHIIFDDATGSLYPVGYQGEMQ